MIRGDILYDEQLPTIGTRSDMPAESGKEAYKNSYRRQDATSAKSVRNPQPRGRSSFSRITLFLLQSGVLFRHSCDLAGVSRRPEFVLLLKIPDRSPDYRRRSDVDLAYFQAR